MPMLSYDDIADWYASWVNEPGLASDPIFSATRTLLGPVDGRHICDLACGQGRITRALAAEGATVVGIDQSANLIAHARRSTPAAQTGITYLVASAGDLGTIPDASFDGVLCHMALMDIADLDAALRSVERILVPGGWFVFSILHPCFHTATSGEIETPSGWMRTVSNYFTEGWWRSPGRPGPPGTVGVYHRTLATYLNAAVTAGLVLERLMEPQFVGSDAARRPIWAEVPAVLIGRWRKP